MSKVWFITGANRGLGAAIAQAALAAGDSVVATARKPAGLAEALGAPERVLAVALDVTQPEQVAAAVATALGRFGRIDVLVNNAGYGQLGIFEETSEAEVRAQFETNVFGLLSITRAILPTMRQQRSGHIFNLSSVAGLRANATGTMYSATKFAVEGFSQGLAEELAPFGIQVTCVSPGGFRTDFLDPSSLSWAEHKLPDYQEAYQARRGFFDQRNRKQQGDPAKLADALVQLAGMPQAPTSFLAGSDAVRVGEGVLEARKAQWEAHRQLSAGMDHADVAAQA